MATKLNLRGIHITQKMLEFSTVLFTLSPFYYTVTSNITATDINATSKVTECSKKTDLTLTSKEKPSFYWWWMSEHRETRQLTSQYVNMLPLHNYYWPSGLKLLPHLQILVTATLLADNKNLLSHKIYCKKTAFWLLYSIGDSEPYKQIILECGPMPNLMVALPNIGGALCSTPQSLADAHY